jgi:hypothetical protein
MQRSLVLLALATLLLSACAPSIRLFDDVCDGLDSDGDGRVDEGFGEPIGCADDEICIDGMCAFECGDGVCSGDATTQETCGTCAVDCGACPACGDGECNGAETCTTCEGDCGACPSCGDGECNDEESCWSCAQDCGLCAGECGACGAGDTCPDGMMCYFVPCTGTLTCGRPEGSACTTWSGASCGSVPVYGRCTSDSQCGAPLTCSGGHCTRTDSWPEVCGPVDCPYPPSSPAGLAATIYCVSASGRGAQSTCVLACTGACPYGMTCTEGRCI